MTPDHDTLAADMRANSYLTGRDPGVYNPNMVGVPVGTVVGANGRRLLVADMPEGVYVGGVLISDPADLDEFAGLLAGLALRRA
jgi:hypothetical protein